MAERLTAAEEKQARAWADKANKNWFGVRLLAEIDRLRADLAARDATIAELRQVLDRCDTVMDTAAQHGVGGVLPPAYRDSWAMVHQEVRAALEAEPDAAK